MLCIKVHKVSKFKIENVLHRSIQNKRIEAMNCKNKMSLSV